jgi:hypothetical protein
MVTRALDVVLSRYVGQQAATDVLADALLPVITASGTPAATRASH